MKSRLKHQFVESAGMFKIDEMRKPLIAVIRKFRERD